ncbi:hypothetical protein ABZ896_36850 [Streptomyces sp. NPDC047072]|uniref:hypothetical protein n=1 Tax=Streptomyces sp. NPDC047072 TaxID=3154809 RepID=UPI0034080B2F
MRTHLLPKSLLAATLGGVVVLVGFGAQTATAEQASTISTVATSDDAEARFLELASIIGQSCSREVSGAAAVTASTAPVDPAPLDPSEQCAAQRHQLRISKAFSGTDTVSYEALRDKLTTLKYPAARIHRMPDFSGEPVARLDLRVGAGLLALQVTDIRKGVMVEAFGAPEGVDVTDVRLKPPLSWPSS